MWRQSTESVIGYVMRLEAVIVGLGLPPETLSNHASAGWRLGRGICREVADA